MSNSGPSIETLDPRKRELLERLLAKEGVDPRKVPILPGAEGQQEFPLSLSQQRLWFLDRLEPGSAAYNLENAFLLQGELEISALRRALDEVVARHASLRTVFGERDGEPFQHIAAPRRQQLPVVDLRSLEDGGEGDQEESAAEDAGLQALQRLVDREAAVPFDLAAGPLLRTTLARIDDAGGVPRHALLFTMHHIVSDGWSCGIFMREVVTLYLAFAHGGGAADAGLEAPKLQFHDYAVWQRRYLDGPALEQQLDFWRDTLEGAPPFLELPTDHPRPAVQTHRGASFGRLLPAALTSQVQARCREAGVTPFAWLLTAFGVLLARASGQRDMVVGTPVAGRHRTEVEGMIGFFINSLPLRLRLERQAGEQAPSFRQLLDRVQRAFLEAHERQDVPFERLVADLDPPRSLARPPVFQVLFNQLNVGQEEEAGDLPGLAVARLVPQDPQAMFDLTFYVSEVADAAGAGSKAGTRYNFSLLYAAALFRRPRLEAFLDLYESLLEAVVEDPQLDPFALNLASAAAALPDPQSALAPAVQESLLERWAGHVAAEPEALALVAGDLRISRSQLQRLAAAVESHLAAAGVQPGDVVAVLARRTPALVAALLGAWRRGAAFALLDAEHPPARLAACAAAAEPRAWIVIEAVDEELNSEEADESPESALGAFGLGEGALRLSADPQTWNLPADADSARPGASLSDGPGWVLFTSGSTGRPRAVLGRRESLESFLPLYRHQLELSSSDRLALLAGLGHDPLLREVFGALSVGATLHVPPPGIQRDGAALAGWLREEGITALCLTPALGTLLRAATGDSKSTERPWPDLRWLVFGGDRLPRELAQALAHRAPGCRVLNLSGATETPQAAAWGELSAAAGSSEAVLGGGVEDMQLLVLAEDSSKGSGEGGVSLSPRLAAAFEPGALALRGHRLALGYLGDAAATADRFRPDPWGDGGRLYLTGDRGRFLEDGAVAFLGRQDRQLKIRGYRVEPTEVEDALSSVPGVAAAAVGLAGEQLVAWWVAEGETENAAPPEVGALRRHLASTLPDASVPSRFLEVEALPLTPNGKVDFPQLPAPDASRPELASAFVAPRTSTERLLAQLWAQLLGVSRVGVEDSFFELGGHSLLAARLAARVEEAFGVRPPLKSFFQAPTVAGFAAVIDEQRRSGKGGGAPAEVLPTLTPDPEALHEPFPLTPIQQAYWVGRAGGVEGGEVSSHRYLELELEQLEPQRLERAWNRLIERHSMLRAVVHSDGMQQILPQVPEYRLRTEDLSGLAPAAAEERLQGIRSELSHQMLSPQVWPLFELRATHLPAAEGAGEGPAAPRWRVHLSFDYLLADAWSFEILLRELVRLYLMPILEMPDLELSFRDYVLAQEALREGELYQASREYWLERLETLPPAPELPRLARRRDSDQAARFLRREGGLDPEAWRRLRQRAARAGLSASSALLAAFSEALAAWCKEPRFTLVLTLFHRLPVHPQVDELVGDFTTTNLLAVDATPDAAFEERARRLQLRLWDDLDHRYFSGVEVLRELARLSGEGLRATMPVVFTSTLDLADAADGASGSADGSGSGAPNPGASGASSQSPVETVFGISQTPQVWLDHQVFEEEGSLRFHWDALDSLFPAGLLDDLFATYRRLLETLAGDGPQAAEAWERGLAALESAPGAGALPAAQTDRRRRYNESREAVLVEPWVPSSERALLHQPWRQRESAHGEAPAVIDGDVVLSHRQLAARARGLARQLVAGGAGSGANVGGVEEREPGALVAILLPKGWRQVVAALAVLEAGAAYLPMDPTLPVQRQRYLLETGGAQLVVGDPAAVDAKALPPGVKVLAVPEEDPVVAVAAADGATTGPITGPQPAGPDDLAYVIFTSGSTGQPKGVMIEHRAALNTVLDINQRFRLEASDRAYGLSSLAFDLSVWDLFGPWSAGGAVVLPAPGSLREPAAWAEDLRRGRVTVWNSVPALMEMLVEHLEAHPEDKPEHLRLVLLSGDWIPLSLPGRLQALLPGVEVVSLGGATEASIWSIHHPIEGVDRDWASIPYGRPLSNQSFHVLDRALAPRPEHVPGDLFIGGAGVARGYWRDEEKTAASFVRHPATGERLYRTGDLGRFRPEGWIEFLGREDFQVKVQGYRIELGEIEAALGTHDSVQDAVVAAVGERAGAKRLAAWILPAEGATVEVAELRQYLEQRLPHYMVPGAFATLESLPLTANGKVDRSALPDPFRRTAAAREEGAAGPSASLAESAGGASVQPGAQGVGDAVSAMAPPAQPSSRLVAAVAEVLGVESVDRSASLLELGASSVDLVRIANRLEDELGVRPPLAPLFHRTLGDALLQLSQAAGQAEAEGGRSNAPVAVSAGDVPGPRFTLLRDPEERDRFKTGQPGLRSVDEGARVISLELEAEDSSRPWLERRSRRRFAQRSLPAESLARLLSPLRQRSRGGDPKYRYGSAGGLYPVQVYLYVKPGAVEGLEPGTYYYDPQRHALELLDPNARLSSDLYGWVNRDLFDSAPLAFYFFGQMRAIGPMYGELSRDFCLVEAGLMSQLLDEKAPSLDIGLCHIGRVELNPVRDRFRLDEDHLFLYSLVAGPVDPDPPGAEATEIGPPLEGEQWEEGEL
ncbi:MAG: amino acid adenylation domain-containing protein [Acidobacteriota bacterium]